MATSCNSVRLYVFLWEITSFKEMGIKAKGPLRGRVAIWVISGDTEGDEWLFLNRP